MKCFDNNNFLEAIKYFNTARIIEETPAVLFCTADVLLCLLCFDKAIPVLEKVIEFEGEKVDTIHKLIIAYDCIADREKTIEYCNKLIPLLDNSKEGIENKIEIYIIISDIYLSQRDEKRAKEAINKIFIYANDDNTKQSISDMLTTIKMQAASW